MPKPYKLKSEIEQFILETKREDPKFSCRKLVLSIKEKFGAEISKSSINVIIKKNRLSSKIGRPRIRQNSAPGALTVEIPAPEAQEPQSEAITKEPAAAPREELTVFRASEKDEPVFEAANYSASSREDIANEEKALTPPARIPPAIEIKLMDDRIANIENGGAIFLLMADYKFGFSRFLTQKIAAYLDELSEDAIRVFLQLKIYGQIIKNESELPQFLGKELVSSDLNYYSEQFSKLPFNQLNDDFIGLGLQRNINGINELYQKSLLFLNKQAQQSFFPSVYQYLEFSAMRERFYSLAARVERIDSLVAVQFLYPPKFAFISDIVWQDDFRASVSNINKERVFTPEGNLFRFEENLAAYQ